MSAKIEVDTKTFIRFWAVPLVFVLVGLFILRAIPALVIVGIALFLAIALKPLARKIDRIDVKTARPGLSSIAAVVIVVSVVLGIFLTVGPVVINETVKFLGSAPTTITETLNGINLDGIGATFGISGFRSQVVAALSDFSTTMAANFSSFAVNSLGAIGSVLMGAVLVIVLTILFMLEGPEIMEKIWSLVSDKNDKGGIVAKRVTTRMAEVVATYVSRQMLVAVLDGVVVMFVVAVLSLIFGLSIGLAIPMGLIAMVMYMIPMFGQIISCLLISVLLLFSSPFAGLVFLVFYGIYAQIENNVIAPKIQGKGMDLPALAILVAITFGTYMFGLIGAIVAIPIAGCIKVLVEEWPEIRRS